MRGRKRTHDVYQVLYQSLTAILPRISKESVWNPLPPRLPIRGDGSGSGGRLPESGRTPQVPSLPTCIRDGDVVTIPGRILGAEVQLVLGDCFQETLTASSNEVTAFVDAPATGPQPAYVLTPFGKSESQTVHCYNLGSGFRRTPSCAASASRQWRITRACPQEPKLCSPMPLPPSFP